MDADRIGRVRPALTLRGGIVGRVACGVMVVAGLGEIVAAVGPARAAGGSTWLALLAVGVGWCALMSVLLTARTTVDAHGVVRRLGWSRRVPVEQVAGVAVRSWSGKQGRQWGVVLTLDDGRVMALPGATWSDRQAGREAAARCLDQVATTLDRPVVPLA